MAVIMSDQHKRHISELYRSSSDTTCGLQKLSYHPGRPGTRFGGGCTHGLTRSSRSYHHYLFVLRYRGVLSLLESQACERKMEGGITSWIRTVTA